ncbi:MAG: LPS export ABC transporter periplasmic protein LptC [Candidatus Aegiribacteria sp.]|nr:LPS export ABC transporter periplasmic protein LptC [Candidatus Aegiribacteria sp.]
MSAGLAVLALLLACGSSDTVDMDPDREPIQIVEDFTLVQSLEGNRSWRLVSELAVYTEGDSLLLLFDIDLTFFEEDIPTTILKGDSGLVELQSGLMRIWDNVIAETDDGRYLETQEIIWNDEMEIFHSDCLVVLTIPDSAGQTVLSGRGVDLDTGLGAVEGVDIEEEFTAVYSGTLDLE